MLGIGLGGALIRDRLEHEHGANGQCHADGQADPSVLHKARDDVHHKGDSRHSQRVGQLRCHVVDVVAVCTCGGHNGRIRDGRAVVAAHGACKARGHADGQDGRIRRIGKQIGHDRNQDAEGAPRGTGCKRQHASHQEDDRGQECGKTCGGAIHQRAHEILGTKQRGHVLERGCQRQDQDRRHHRNEAVGNALDRFLEGHALARYEINDRYDKRDQTAPRQADRRVGITECADEIALIIGTAPDIHTKEAADVQKRDHGDHDQNGDRDDQIKHAGALVVYKLIAFAVAARCAKITRGLRQKFVLSHCAVIITEEDDGTNEHQRQQGIEVEGNGADEQLQTLTLRCIGGNGSGPAGNGRDHADRCRGGVDQIGKLRAGDLVSLRHGAHHGANREAVEIVVDKDQHAKHEGGEHRAYARFNVGLRPATERRRAAAAIQERHDGTQLHKEDENARGVGRSGDQTVADQCIHASRKGEVGVKQGTRKDTHEQGAVHLFGDERKTNRNDRRNQCPEGTAHHSLATAGLAIHARAVAIHTLDRTKRALGHARHDHHNNDDHNGNQKRDLLGRKLFQHNIVRPFLFRQNSPVCFCKKEQLPP